MIAEMLSYAFMQRAFIAAFLVAITAPLVGLFLVQRSLSLIGDGMGHVALAGVGLGVVTNNHPIWMALAACVVAAVLIELMRSLGKTQGDVAIAVMFYGGIALGVVLMSKGPPQASGDLTSYLFGSIVSATTEDLYAFAALTALIVGLVATFGSRVFSVGSDEEYAKAVGMPVLGLNVLLSVLAAVTVVMSMRIIGLFLISAIMVLPVAAAQRVAWSFTSTLLIALGLSLVICLSGTVGAYAFDTPSGGTIVLFGIAVFILALIASMGKSMIVRRRSASAFSTDGQEREPVT